MVERYNTNRFGEKNISIPTHPPTPIFFEDEYGMTREEEYEELDWSNDPRSESSHERHIPRPSGVPVSDECISRHAKISLSLSPELGNHFIEIKVINGCVYLDGFVKSRTQKRAAEFCVESVPGVIDVFNRLNITHS